MKTKKMLLAFLSAALLRHSGGMPAVRRYKRYR